ncbi:hypothetical protein LSTR_LSTR014296 [Laodelphax striatellus]|uniref:Uncharacterized protein n=1 Tax=Laodelphax striatellus TaxID=195883 RepID=A0A482WZH2_LAOST|nr:hypothetical protein LSTR_LSTR014296 [Laodelphax striatellus]
MAAIEHLTVGSTDPPLVEGKLRLYSMRFCPYAARVHLVLNAKKIPYDPVYINLINKPEWYTSRIPTGKVPALVTEGTDLYESLIIANYLDEKYPENKLQSDDPLRKAKDSILIESFGKVGSIMYKMYFNDIDTETFDQFLGALDDFEKELSSRGTTFYGGNTVKLVDYMLWPFFERMSMFALPDKPQFKIPESRFPCLTKWMSAMKGDEAVKQHYLRPDQHAHHLNMRKAGTPDYIIIE